MLFAPRIVLCTDRGARPAAHTAWAAATVKFHSLKEQLTGQLGARSPDAVPQRVVRAAARRSQPAAQIAAWSSNAALRGRAPRDGPLT